MDIAGPSMFQPRALTLVHAPWRFYKPPYCSLSLFVHNSNLLRVSVMFMPLSNSLPVLGSSEMPLNQYMWLEPSYRNRNIQLTKQCRTYLLSSSRLSITVGVVSNLMYSPQVLRPSPLLDLHQDYHTLHRRIVINAEGVYTKISKD